jgi:cytoskeletal protein RodZ
MSQNASVSQTSVLNPSEAAQSGQDFARAQLDLNQGLEGNCDSVADRLMDELFADVERMLERGVDLSPEPAEPTSAAIQSRDLVVETAPPPTPEMPGFALASKLSPRPSILEQAKTEEELADLAELMAEVSEEQVAPKPRSFDKLLLSLVIASFALAGGLWFYWRDRFRPPITATASPSAEQMQQQQNQEFLKYVGRSLDRIERDAKAQREAAAIAAAGASPTPAASPSPSTVLERVYIPIYQQPPAATTPARSGVAPAPSLPTTAPAIPPAPVTVAPPAASTIPNISPSATHVLIGVLELGSRSAALFEINGTPQRIQIGESIGDSGWTLVSIANQEAIVRRNGEVRSIYVGQKF